MVTAKFLGFKRGDFVDTGAFPGVVVAYVDTYQPVVEVWGMERGLISVYAKNLRRISFGEFQESVRLHEPGTTLIEGITKAAKEAIRTAERLASAEAICRSA